jgi:hypothetical protein
MLDMQNFLSFFQHNWFLAILVFLLGLELIWIIFLQISLSRIKAQKSLDIKGDAKSLEEVVAKQAQAIKTLDGDIRELYDISNQINTLAFRGLHKFGMIRFNPFKEVGGDQSFAIAMLNGKNNGIALSSLYTREGTRIYAKALSVGKSEKYPLTEEEEEAIKMAISQENKKVKI